MKMKNYEQKKINLFLRNEKHPGILNFLSTFPVHSFFIFLQFRFSRLIHLGETKVFMLEHNLLHPVESTAKLGWRTWIIVRQEVGHVHVFDLFSLWWRRTIGVMDFGATEVAVVGSLNVQVVEHALVENALCIATAKRRNHDENHT